MAKYLRLDIDCRIGASDVTGKICDTGAVAEVTTGSEGLINHGRGAEVCDCGGHSTGRAIGRGRRATDPADYDGRVAACVRGIDPGEINFS